MALPRKQIHRKSFTRRFLERTARGRFLGFEAYVFVAHRITGLALLAFLLWHLSTLSTIFSGSDAYEQTRRSMDEPIFKLGEVILIGMVCFHALNGLRMIILNLAPQINHRQLAYLVPAISVAMMFIGATIIF